MDLVAVGSVVFVAGLVLAFVGSGVRGRLRALVVMSVGALLGVAVAAVEVGAGITQVVVAAATLLGMLVFAAAVARRLLATGDDSLDEDPV